MRIKPKIARSAPARKGKKPAPGVWKFPNLNVIDPKQIPIPIRTQISPSARRYFFIGCTYPCLMSRSPAAGTDLQRSSGFGYQPLFFERYFSTSPSWLTSFPIGA